MAAIPGRNGRLYMGITSAGVPTPIAFLNKLAFDQTTDKFDVTSFGDSNKNYVAGLPDFKGTFAGFYDNATAQMYTAALDGVSRKFYLYPDTTNAGQYWYGNAFFDFSVALDVNGTADISGGFSAASAISKIG